MIKKNTGNLLALSFILVFGLLAIIRLYPFTNELSEILNGPLDDWKMYAQTALDIKNNGLGITSQAGDYDYPNGFFYNYFLAFCFFIFGENTTPVYILQSCTLGLVIWIVYNTYKNRMLPKTGIVFISIFFVLALLDMNLHYSFRFLSENIVILSLSLFFYFLKNAFDKKKNLYFILSALSLGLSLMTRPNLLPIVIVIGLVMSIFLFQKKMSGRNYLFFISVLIASSSLIALRNVFVTGQLTFFPVNSFAFFKIYFFHPDLILTNIAHKFMFCLGYLSFINPAFQWRIHWTMIWIIYLLYLITKIRRKEKTEEWEKIIHLLILLYTGMLIFIIDTNLIGCYGFRYVIPAIFSVLPYSILFLEKFFIRNPEQNRNKLDY